MSDLYFPTFDGIAWGSVKTPIWSTKIHTSSGGYEFRASQFTYPLWKFRVNYEVLRGGKAHDEIHRLMGFFNQCRGAYLPFLYQCPDDHQVVDEPFGLTQNTVLEYQLTRALGGFTEPVIAPANSINIYVDGVLKAFGMDYVIRDGGKIYFLQSTPSGKALTWTGSFYFKCRFLHDTADFEEFMYDLWAAKKIEFQSVRE